MAVQAKARACHTPHAHARTRTHATPTPEPSQTACAHATCSTQHADLAAGVRPHPPPTRPPARPQPTHHAVRVVHRQRHLLEEPACLLLLEEAAVGDELQQVAASGVLHGQHKVAVGQKDLRTQGRLVAVCTQTTGAHRRQRRWQLQQQSSSGAGPRRPSTGASPAPAAGGAYPLPTHLVQRDDERVLELELVDNLRRRHTCHEREGADISGCDLWARHVCTQQHGAGWPAQGAAPKQNSWLAAHLPLDVLDVGHKVGPTLDKLQRHLLPGDAVLQGRCAAGVRGRGSTMTNERARLAAADGRRRRPSALAPLPVCGPRRPPTSASITAPKPPREMSRT